MQLKKYITFLASALLLFACAKEEFDTPTSTPDGPVTVGFWVGRGDTRTETPNAGFELDAPLGAETTRTHASSFGNNKLSVSWSNGDQVAMWAKPQNGTDYTFSNQTFKNWFVSADSQNAYFTADLKPAMADGTYNYYVCYPTPAEGTTNAFTIPSTQDGKMGGGADIMMAQGSGIALQSLDSDGDFVIDKPEGYPSFTMKHLIHSLMFYVPAGNNWGFPDNETIERIVFTMPSSASGTVTADVKADAPALSTPTNGSNTIALNLTDPIGPSSGNDLDFAAAAIIPPSTTFGEGDNITIKVYTQTKAASQSISLNGRGTGAQYDNMRMAANRVTPVVLNCSTVTDRPKISFRIENNYLGEQPYKITLTFAETSTKWKDGDDHIYEFYTGSETSTIAKGSGFDLYSNEELLSTISGKSVTVTYESKSAIVTETITMPPLTATGPNNVNLNVPYLFSENFSTIQIYDGDYTAGPYTSVDAATTAARDLSQHGLSAGWSGARTGCDTANTAILVSGRVDNVLAGATRAYGRLDSPTLSTIKPNCSIKVNVSFSYSGAEEENIDYYYPVGKCGYTTDDGMPNGYATQFNNSQAFSGIEGAVDIPSIPTNGSATNAQNGEKSMNYTINNCTSEHRLSWHVMQYGFKYARVNNDYGILYIDNIKVQIVP